MPPPTLQASLKTQGPTFVRKLARAVHWGQPSDPIDQRVKDAVAKVFRNQQEPAISLYLVGSDEELRRVAVGMNANRDSLHEALAFAVILPEELVRFGIETTQSPGDLLCEFANRLHYDAVATDQQLEDLCRFIMTAGRTEGRCTGGMMKAAAHEAGKEGCAAATKINPCRVPTCPAPPAPTQSADKPSEESTA